MMAPRLVSWPLIAMMALCTLLPQYASALQVGPPEVLQRISGLEAVAFVGPEAPGGPAIICSRLDQASFTWELLQIPLDGGEPQFLGHGRDVDARGSIIAWVGSEPSSEGIWLRDLATDESPVRLSASLETSNPSISPDGRSVACTRDTGRRVGIFRLRAGARRLETITNRDERDPAWGPREDLMLGIKAGQLWLLGGSRWQEMRQVRLTDNAMVHFDPAWHPGGRWVAFAAGWTEQRAQVGLLQLDTRRILWPAPQITGVRSPAFSPDGSKLAFVAGEGEDAVLYLCKLGIADD